MSVQVSGALPGAEGGIMSNVPTCWELFYTDITMSSLPCLPLLGRINKLTPLRVAGGSFGTTPPPARRMSARWPAPVTVNGILQGLVSLRLLQRRSLCEINPLTTREPQLSRFTLYFCIGQLCFFTSLDRDVLKSSSHFYKVSLGLQKKMTLQRLQG